MTFQNGAIVATDFELRAVPGERPKFTGYANVFDSPSDPRLGFKERIAPGAFARSLKAPKANYMFVLDHDEKRQIATTKAGNLRLSEDSKGLLTEADLPDVTAARDLIGYYEAGMVRGMSFMFKPQNYEIVDGGVVRHTTVQLRHVTASVSDDPVYAETTPTIQIRALADELDVDAEDLDGLIDALRGGDLTTEQRSLLDRLATHYRPPTPEPEPVEPAVRSLDEVKALLARGAHLLDQ